MTLLAIDGSCHKSLVLLRHVSVRKVESILDHFKNALALFISFP
jgi:hypothetical protein